MVNDRSYFQPFTAANERCHFVDIAVNAHVAGKGTIVLYNHGGTEQPLKNVMYIPSFKVNLTSLSKADASGFTGHWGRSSFTVEDPSGQLVIRSRLQGASYHAKCTAWCYATLKANGAATQPDAALVSRRYGKVACANCPKCLATMLCPIFQIHQPAVCGVCQEGGTRRCPFNARSSRLRQLLHTPGYILTSLVRVLRVLMVTSALQLLLTKLHSLSGNLHIALKISPPTMSWHRFACSLQMIIA